LQRRNVRHAELGPIGGGAVLARQKLDLDLFDIGHALLGHDPADAARIGRAAAFIELHQRVPTGCPRRRYWAMTAAGKAPTMQTVSRLARKPAISAFHSRPSSSAQSSAISTCRPVTVMPTELMLAKPHSA